ncbi:hypothetical protein EXVG_00304 [Emiliania huxleyi virus 202]|nr:hypothetical protein EXVG_00304 [Emiliania huxleyi virus 202]AHA54248.1 hypothetical protein EhV18_00201 [Emiliania huxleyi virus 18]AHA55297.1 hypothetical protein EhV156_00201 [Emiliania huxleyi virus 156]
MFSSVKEFQDMGAYDRVDRIKEYFNVNNNIHLSWKADSLMKFVEPYRSMIYGSTRAYTYNLEKLNLVMEQIHYYAVLVYTGYQNDGEFVGFRLDQTLLHYRPESIMKIVEHDVAYSYSTANILRLPIDFIVAQKCIDLSKKRRRMIQEKFLKYTVLSRITTFYKFMPTEPQCRYETYLFRVSQNTLLSHTDPTLVSALDTVREQLKTIACQLISSKIVHLPIYERTMTRRYHPSNGYIEASMQEFDFVR